MDVLQTLESNVTTWQDAISERTQRAAFLRGECDRLVSESIDLSEPKAKQARTKRAEYLAELELIDAQLSEVTRRHDVAVQAVREYQITQAREAYEKADTADKVKRQALNAAIDERLRFNNSHGRETEASINARKQIEINIATLQAAARIAAQKQAEAGAALQALRV